MNRRSPASMTNPAPVGADCAWTVRSSSGLMVGDSAIPIVIATAQRFAARERRLNGNFTLMISPPLTAVYADTHVEQLRPIGVVGLLSVGDRSKRVRLRVDRLDPLRPPDAHTSSGTVRTASRRGSGDSVEA